MKEKKWRLKNRKIQKHLLIIHKHVIMFLKNWNQSKKRLILIVFDDMVADMEANDKVKSYHYSIVFERNKTEDFTRFYITMLFQRAKNHKIKRNALFYHENV